jgi:hypothetical protein
MKKKVKIRMREFSTATMRKPEESGLISSKC